jgi:hypothetical protein
MIMESTNHRVHRAPAPCAVPKSSVRGEETTLKKTKAVRRSNNHRGRSASTSGTGLPEVRHADYRLQGPGANRIIVHRF